MSRISKEEAEFYIKCNKLFITELKRIRTRFEKNRVKELQELIEIDEELENTSERDLQDAYGWEAFSEEEYYRKLKELEEYHERKERLKNMPTIQTQMLNLIDACIGETKRENQMIEMDAMTDEEKAEYQRKRERRQKARKKKDEP